MVPSLTLDLGLSSCHQKVLKWQFISFKVMKFSLKQSHSQLIIVFDWEKLSSGDFLMITWEPEDESQRKRNHKFHAYNKTFVIIFEQGDTVRLRETFGVLYHYSSQHFYWLDDDVKSSNLYICLLSQYIWGQ